VEKRLDLVLPPLATAPGQARAALRDSIGVWCDTQQVDDAVLLVSELVTNAVVHGSPPVGLSVEASDGTIRVEVTDSSPVVPGVHVLSHLSAQGRGLAIVRDLSTRWGVDQISNDGKRIWFELRA
jgi:anti-sigma regulatory factor (Ser/Thr protein kinase)